MTNCTIDDRAIFVEQNGWAYYVANWQQRFAEPVRAMLVRLSPRHFVRYNALKEKGRGQKSIAYLLFKRVPAQVVKDSQQISKAPSQTPLSQTPKAEAPTVVVIELEMLTAEQLVRLIQRSLHGEFPGLQALPLNELRQLYVSIQAKIQTQKV
jgi:hypothetical protein